MPPTTPVAPINAFVTVRRTKIKLIRNLKQNGQKWQAGQFKRRFLRKFVKPNRWRLTIVTEVELYQNNNLRDLSANFFIAKLRYSLLFIDFF